MYIKRGYYAAAFFLVFGSLYSVAHGASSAQIAASVTVQNISVTVSSGTISYGTLATNTSKSTIAADLNNTQTVTNNGNVTEDINIRGTNSASWTLSGAAGPDQYVHKFCISSCGTPPTNFTALTTVNQTLVDNVAKDGTQTFDLQLTTPTTTSVFTQQSVDVTVQASAS